MTGLFFGIFALPAVIGIIALAQRIDKRLSERHRAEQLRRLEDRKRLVQRQGLSRDRL